MTSLTHLGVVLAASVWLLRHRLRGSLHVLCVRITSYRKYRRVQEARPTCRHGGFTAALQEGEGGSFKTYRDVGSGPCFTALNSSKGFKAMEEGAVPPDTRHRSHVAGEQAHWSGAAMRPSDHWPHLYRTVFALRPPSSSVCFCRSTEGSYSHSSHNYKDSFLSCDKTYTT